MKSQGARRQLLVDRAARRRQRQERLPAGRRDWPGGSRTCAPQAAPPRARPWSCACGCWAPIALPVMTPNSPRRDQHPPFRYSDTVSAIDLGQGLGHQAGQHIEAMGQEVFELEQGRLGWGGAGRRGVLTDRTGVHYRPRPGRWSGRLGPAAILRTLGETLAEDHELRNGGKRPVDAATARTSSAGTRWRRIRRARWCQWSPARYRAGDLVAVDLAEGGGLDEVARPAIGGGDRQSRRSRRWPGSGRCRSRRSCWLMMNMRFSACARRAESSAREDERGEQIPHR